MNSVPRIMFAAEMSSWGTPRLVKVIVIKETDKTYKISIKAVLVGSNLYRSIVRKGEGADDVKMFEQGKDAAAWLVEQGEKYIAKQQADIKRCEKLIEPLRTISAAAK